MDQKVCGVCSDKALNYNFNAVTCESCKAFFRRNALTNKVFKCPFEGRCDINTVTRRFCQRCRLDKCFAIGMKKDMIMTDQDKEIKKKKIEENKALKRANGFGFKKGFKKVKKPKYYDNHSDDYSNSSMSPESTTSSSLQVSPESVQKLDESGMNPLLHSMITNNNHLNCNHNSPSPVSTTQERVEVVYTDIDVARDVLQDVQQHQQQNRSEANAIESILCEAIKLEFDAYSSMAHSRGPSRELNDAERAKLNELIVANKTLSTPVDEDATNWIAEDCRKVNVHNSLLADPALLDVINLTAVAIRRLIKMAKKINAFKNMCQEDQVALLKGGCTEMMILRSVMNYDSSKQTWKIPHTKEYLGNLKADVLKQAKGNIYQEHERFITTFDQKWRNDENIILILCAITLFTPDRARVVHQDVIKLEQNSYYYLLRRYLESVYPGCEAKSTFLKLIQKISELHKMNEEVINCYLDVNPSDVEPLLLEIFDLKH